MNAAINAGLCYPGDKVTVITLDGRAYVIIVDKEGYVTVPNDTRYCWVNGKLTVDLSKGWPNEIY